jgi:hypothetical protein
LESLNYPPTTKSLLANVCSSFTYVHIWGVKHLIVLWIDDNLIIGSKKVVEKTKEDIMERFDCEDCGDIEEYVGCKIVRTNNSLKFTQPVLMQSYNERFELP